MADRATPLLRCLAALIDHLQELAELSFDLLQLVFAGFPDTTNLRLFADKVRPAF